MNIGTKHSLESLLSIAISDEWPLFPLHFYTVWGYNHTGWPNKMGYMNSRKKLMLRVCFWNHHNWIWQRFKALFLQMYVLNINETLCDAPSLQSVSANNQCWFPKPRLVFSSSPTPTRCACCSTTLCFLPLLLGPQRWRPQGLSSILGPGAAVLSLCMCISLCV